jgi:Protein of unknown function (DUF2877)
MMVPASCSSAVRAVLFAPARQAEVLGRCRSAVYLRVHDDVIALVTPDALRLPCAVVVPVLPVAEPVMVGDGVVAWHRIVAPIVREWAPAIVPRVRPRSEQVARLRSVYSTADICLDVESTIGRGPGLTPSGDDVLAGYLLGCRAVATDAGAMAAAVRTNAHRTTALSAALLHHAIAGRCLPEVAAVVRALESGDLDTPLAALLRVGHTSGAALAYGLALAAGIDIGVAA